MKIAFNPSNSSKNILDLIKNNKDIIFDLKGHSIYARGVEFKGTDTNTWRPVVDNLTSNSATSSLSANQGRVLAGLINGKSDSDHNHDGRYVKKSGDTMLGALNFANGTWNLVGDDSYMGDCNISGHFGIKAANTTYPGIAFFNNASAFLGNLTAYSGNIKYGAYSLQFLDNGNTSVSASTWTNPFSAYNSNAVADGQAICVWGQASQLSNLSTDTGDMSLWLKRVNAKAATLNMVLDGEYYANGNQRLAHISEIPTSLKNPHALTISLNGTSQGPYDGSAAKNINITPSSIGAATSDHNHDGRYVYNYGETQMDGASVDKNALGMTTNSGVTGDWWHILQAAWNGEYRWNSQIAFPTQNRNGMYYRSGLDDNTKWGSWVKLLDTNNYSGVLDSRYYTESEVDSLLDAKLNRQNLSYGTWNPRGYNLAADYFYNGGDLSISESGGQIHVSVDGYFWQNEGRYRVLDTSDVAGLKGDLTVHQYLSDIDTTWWPLIWGGSFHANTHDSTGAVYKSHDVLSWQTSSQTLYATHLRTTYIDLENSRRISQVTSGGTSPFKGIKLPDLQSNGIGMFSKIGDGADEGGIIISADTSVIYNSFDTGWGLTIRDKDKGQMNISGDGTIAFGVRQDYRAYSLGGFEKSGSSNSYVLLGGGDHKLEGALNVANADMVDGYHENSFLRYREHTNTNQEVTLWSQIGIKEYYGALPDGLTNIYNYGSVISLSGIYSRFEIYASHISSSGNGLYYRSGWGDDKKSWLKFIDSSNIGSQSVNYANSAGSAISATKVIVNQHTSNDINYPLVWSNQANTSSVTENQLFKSWTDLYYNPKHKSLTVGGCFVGPYGRFTNQNGALIIGDSANARISAIGDQVVFNTGSAIRFGGTDWEYSDWAGLKYDTTANTIYLGIAEGTVFNYNEKKRSNGILRLAGISYIDLNSGTSIRGLSTTGAPYHSSITLTDTSMSLSAYESIGMSTSFGNVQLGYSGLSVDLMRAFNIDAGGPVGISTGSVFAVTATDIRLTCKGGSMTCSQTGANEYTWIFSNNIKTTGQIIREGSSQMWVNGRNGALLRETSVAGYHTLWSLKTTDGSWDFGEYNAGSKWNNIPVLTYITDSDYNSGNNRDTYQIKFPLASGTVALTSQASSFDVNTAQYLRSLGNQNCQTGRTQNYGDVYTYNTYNGNTGSPTTYTSVIGFGRGIAGTVEIAGGWVNTNLYWRSLRDCYEDWYSWRTVLDSNNYTDFIGSYYWANVKISTSSSTTTSPTVDSLTALSYIKMSNIRLEHTDEINNIANGGLHLNYRNSGDISLCKGGGNVGIGTLSPTYKLHVNGTMGSNGFHHFAMDSNDYVLLAGGGYMIHKTGTISGGRTTAIQFGKYVWLTLQMDNAPNDSLVVPNGISRPTKDIYVVDIQIGSYDYARNGIYRVAPNGKLYHVRGQTGQALFTTICYVASS